MKSRNIYYVAGILIPTAAVPFMMVYSSLEKAYEAIKNIRTELTIIVHGLDEQDAEMPTDKELSFLANKKMYVNYGKQSQGRSFLWTVDLPPYGQRR